MPVITAHDAPRFDTGEALITGLASPSRGASETAAWRVRFHGQAPSPVHALDREEVFVVLEGALTARYGEAEETAHAGGALVVPAGVEFSLVPGEGGAEAVCMLPVGGQAILDGQRFTPPWAQ
jgi:mannose-6-phosphate isomerase-like protein (cupin superfamily)